MSVFISSLGAYNELYESPYPPTYAYTTLSTGFSLSSGNGDISKAVPLSFQTGVLSNSDSGSMAMGFGTRMDIGFGIGSSDRDLSLDMVMGLDMLFRFNSTLALDVLAGYAVGFVDTDNKTSILTMGPGLSAALRVTPAGFSAIALDAGAAIYGQFGIGDEYAGFNFVPYVSVTFDISAWYMLFYPFYGSHMIIF